MKLTIKTEKEIEVEFPIYRISQSKSIAYAFISETQMITICKSEVIGYAIEFRTPLFKLIDDLSPATETEFLQAYAECQSIQNKKFMECFAKPNEFILQQSERAGETD